MTAAADGIEDLASVAFVLTVRPGMTHEYRRRHAEIWPEVTEALRGLGILRYEIYLCEETRQVFGLQLRQPGLPPSPEPPAMRRWRAHMADVLDMDGDVPRRAIIERVFLLTASTSGATPNPPV